METMNEVISRITSTVRVIKESFEGYGGVIHYPHKPLFPEAAQCHDVQLLQNEHFQGCTHPRTQGGSRPKGS